MLVQVQIKQNITAVLHSSWVLLCKILTSGISFLELLCFNFLHCLRKILQHFCPFIHPCNYLFSSGSQTGSDVQNAPITTKKENFRKKITKPKKTKNTTIIQKTSMQSVEPKSVVTGTNLFSVFACLCMNFKQSLKGWKMRLES